MELSRLHWREESLPVPTSDVVFKTTGSLAEIIFDRPEARNAMTWPMYDALIEHCDAVDADENIRVLILRGAGGKAFVSGTDISQFKTFKTDHDGLEYERRIDRVVTRLEHVSVPTIAAIHGVATGGGCALAAACDLRICTTDSRFGIPIARTLGNCLSMSNVTRLLNLVGPVTLKEMVFTGRLFSAAEAAGAGFINKVVDPDLFESTVNEYAETVASNAPLTIRATKEMIRRIEDDRTVAADTGSDLIVECYTSDDFHGGVDSFLKKQSPTWTGR